MRYCSLFELSIKSCQDVSQVYDKLREGVLPFYQLLTIKMAFHERFFPDRAHPFYTWNEQTFTSLGHYLLVALTNKTCTNYFKDPQAYKIVNIHAHEVSRYIILFRLIHEISPHIGLISGDVQSNLATLGFKWLEQL